MIHQYRNIMTLMYIFAHTYILRRKQRGIKPQEIKNGIGLQDQLNIQLDDGTLDIATLLKQSLEYLGSNSADTITLAEITGASAAFLGEGDDVGIGNSFANQLYGENGQDRLQGRKGLDVLVGGQGEDTFIFEAGDGNENITRLAA